jgi:hypothetical protein
MTTIGAGPRLDRLPVSAFHRRVFVLVAMGMFFDGFDIYVLVALLFGVYIPELFPTEVRLRASGICNTSAVGQRS